ncbi:MAG: colicin E5-related ribonuclease, partial [Phreatobacter sp.]
AAVRAANRSTVSGHAAGSAPNAAVKASSAPGTIASSGPEASGWATERVAFPGHLRPGGIVETRGGDAGPSEAGRRQGGPVAAGGPPGQALPSQGGGGGAPGMASADYARYHEMLQGPAERPQRLDAGTVERARRAYGGGSTLEVSPAALPVVTDVAARRLTDPAPDTGEPRLIVDGARGGVSSRRQAAPGFAPDAAPVRTTIEPKIEAQLGQRGWTRQAIEDLIARPDRTVPTRHSRFDEVQGKRLDDPAMGYAARDGAYVVRNERTGGVVQVSDKRQPGWKAPW